MFRERRRNGVAGRVDANTDMINACFEGVGAVLVWRNVHTLRRDRQVRGVDWRVQAFWAVWGLWNILYYGNVGHPLSAVAGAVLAAGNLTWTYIAASLVWGKPLQALVRLDRDRAQKEAARRD